MNYLCSEEKSGKWVGKEPQKVAENLVSKDVRVPGVLYIEGSYNAWTYSIFRQPFSLTCVKRSMNKLLLFEMTYLKRNKYFE